MEMAANRAAAAHRRQELLAEIRSAGSVPVSTLATKFSVSNETLRRDLRVLEERGEVERGYGTVRALASSTFESTVQQRATLDIAQKQRIARAAAEYIRDANTVYIDEGHLPSLIVNHLPHRPLTAVTPSLPSAHLLARQPLVTAIQVGGRVRPATSAVVDHFAVSMLTSLSIDLAFIGANGIDTEGWLTTPDPAVAAIKEAAINASRRTVFVGTHTKFGKSTFVRFCHMRALEAAITGVELRAGKARQFAQWGTPLVRA